MNIHSGFPADGAAPPALDLDPYSDEYILNPDPYRAMLRDAAPVVYLPKYGVYAAARYEDVKAILIDHANFSTTAGICLVDLRDPKYQNYRRLSPVNEVDPPAHTKVRSALQKFLSPVVIRGWRKRYEEVAGEIIDKVMAFGAPFNAVPELSENFIYQVMPESLGLDIPREHIRALGEMNSFSMGPDTERRRASLERSREAVDYYNRATERENVKPGTFGDSLIKAEDEGIFEPGTGAGLLRVFLRSATENQHSMVSAVIHRLAEHPDQWEKLKNDPGKIKNAIEETVRLDAPLEVDYRVLMRDVDYKGVRLEKDKKIGIYFTAANRDPRVWDRPDEFDVDRDVMGKHLGFSAGAHSCIGQMIARFQAEALLQAMVVRVDRIELAGEPERKIVSSINSLKNLPIRLVAR